MICPICGKEILPDDKMKRLPLDRPIRANLPVHRECFYQSIQFITESLQKNKDLWYNNK